MTNAELNLAIAKALGVEVLHACTAMGHENSGCTLFRTPDGFGEHGNWATSALAALRDLVTEAEGRGYEFTLETSPDADPFVTFYREGAPSRWCDATDPEVPRAICIAWLKTYAGEPG